jgi:hypothetical protein
MRFLIAGRQEGKTTKILGWFLETPERKLIVHSEQEAKRLRELVPEDRERDIVAIWAWREARLGRQVRQYEVAVDNLDLVLQGLLHHDVSLVAATGNLEEE